MTDSSTLTLSVNNTCTTTLKQHHLLELDFPDCLRLKTTFNISNISGLIATKSVYMGLIYNIITLCM